MGQRGVPPKKLREIVDSSVPKTTLGSVLPAELSILSVMESLEKSGDASLDAVTTSSSDSDSLSSSKSALLIFLPEVPLELQYYFSNFTSKKRWNQTPLESFLSAFFG